MTNTNNEKKIITLMKLQQMMSQRLWKSEETMTYEERAEFNEDSKYFIGFAKQMINNANTIKDWEKLAAQGHILERSRMEFIVGSIDDVQ